jgi:hypothetical protein
MEETLNMIREARPKLLAKANRRAGERQLFQMRPAGLEENATDNEPKKGDDDNSMLKGGNEAGLRRVIGKGRKRVPKGMHRMPDGSLMKDSEHKGMGKLTITHGGAHCSDSSDSDEETGGARLAGRMLKEHIEKLHGGRYSKRFLKGMGLVGAEFGRPSGREVAHAVMTGPVAGRARGAENLVPGAIAPVALGNPPQAPKSFARNSIDQSRAGELSGSGMAGAGAMSKRQERGRQIAQIMRERQCSLADASRILKQMKSE